MNLKSINILLGLEIVYLFLTFLWINDGTIDYGIGLGGLLFYYLSIGACVLFMIPVMLINLMKNKKRAKITGRITLVITTLVCLFITYSFTIGRGFECPWNGQIFNPSCY